VSNWMQNASDSKESGPVEDLLEDQSRVKVMTIHQAKGLEFNSVIIYDLRPGPDREKYISDEFAGIVVKRDTDFISSPSRKIIGKSERHSFSLNEESRVMYVAFTRAKNDLHIVLSEKDLKEQKAAKKGDDIISLLQKTIGLWRESDVKERNVAIEKMSMIPSKTVKTEALPEKKTEQSPDFIVKMDDASISVQNDEDNENAIVQFLSDKGDKIKDFRIVSIGRRVTVSEKGVKIYEDRPLPNNYFVRNGRIDYIL
ncbi:MAG: 3'-5' exonuclease, partial [Thermoplasmatales archaeon]